MTALVCTALMPGCPKAQTATDPALPPVGAFAISYAREGGLAASFAKLTVVPGRRATATSEGGRAGDRTVRFTLGIAQVSALQRELARARFANVAAVQSGGCADCFLYTIRYLGHTVAFDDSTKPARLDGVIGRLESLISAHTIPPEA